MRPAPLVLAAILLLGCAAGAAGTPLIPILAGVALQSHSDIEAARWRHRHHRGYFWGDRGTDGADSDGTARFSSQPNIDLEATKWRHRHGRDYDWIDRSRVSLRKFHEDLGSILRHARVTGGETACVLLLKARPFTNRSLASLRRLYPRRLGDHIRSSWRSARARAPHLRRTHVVVGALASFIVLPAGYVAYCMATLPAC